LKSSGATAAAKHKRSQTSKYSQINTCKTIKIQQRFNKTSKPVKRNEFIVQTKPKEKREAERTLDQKRTMKT